MSSTDVQLHGARAPPPTPNQGNGNGIGNGNGSPVASNDAFSAFLERSLGLANLVLPESPTATGLTDRDLPVIDLSGEECVKRIAEAAAEFGCFQVVNHGVCSQIVERAEEECNRLFGLPMEKKDGICRSIGFPYGFEDGGCDTSTSFRHEMFWLHKDAAQIEDFMRNEWPEGCENFSRAVGDYSAALEKVSSEILELLLDGLGNWPERSNFTQEVASNNTTSLLCITSQKGAPKVQSARISHSHPYILSLHYQTTSYGYHVYVDRSWVRVFPQPGSLMVILGDILKVWSNGEYKSVVGRPVGDGKGEEEGEEEEGSCTWMALLYSPARETTISPIAELLGTEKRPRFSAFALKDYASRLQKQRFAFKDPLDRYKIN